MIGTTFKVVVISICIFTTSFAQTCPNQCSGHGLCETPDLRCSCFSSWTGGDCSMKVCPSGAAWADQAISEDTAHRLAECSNMGICDRRTGRCQCYQGFTGSACDKLHCPNECSGHGMCMSMHYFARSKDPGYGPLYAYDIVWDADKIFGCKCDPGYTGFDCSLRECPKGDDPMTNTGEYEVQLFLCKASAGKFTISFDGSTSEPISVSSNINEFRSALYAMATTRGVLVSFSESGQNVCSTSINQVISLTFTENFGDVPNMYSSSTSISSCSDPSVHDYDICGGSGIQFAYDGDSLMASGGAVISVKGSKENEYCSRRGACDMKSGICACFEGYETSNGRGGEGTRGDCGRVVAPEVTACPGEVACSSHGYCTNAPDYVCICSVGWQSGDCSERTCPLGKSWFDLPVGDNKAHQPTECSNMGVCDRSTGLCVCYEGFEGSACQYKSCPGSPNPCSGHGSCLSMEQLAHAATYNGDSASTTYGAIPNDPLRWDYDMMRGCLCDQGYMGYDCSLKACPTGDDPETVSNLDLPQVHEKQLIRCRASSGTFQLKFRQSVTDPIAHDASADEVSQALKALNTITGRLDVRFKEGNQFCTNATNMPNVVTVTFLSDLGDVPAISATYVSTLHHDLGALIEVASDGAKFGNMSSVMGSMENLECSNRGICDYSLGSCACFAGYGSSNGNRDSGSRGDCGWKIPYFRANENEDDVTELYNFDL